MISTLSTVCVTWLQNALTGNKLYACNAFCHRDAQRVTMSPGARHYRRAKLFQPVQAEIRTLPRRCKSQQLPQCCRSVYILHSPVTLHPTKLNFVPECNRESFLMKLRELLPGPGWVICGGRHYRRVKIFHPVLARNRIRALNLQANTLPRCY